MSSKKRVASKQTVKDNPKIIHLKSVTSTNDYAKQLAARGAPHGTAIRADVQTRGRGRLGAKWASPPGGLWMSIILRPEGGAGGLNLVPAMASLVVMKTLRNLGVDGGIKWPNDVSVRGRKIAGILCESNILSSQVQWIVVGIGINVNNSPRKITGLNSAYEAESVITQTGVKTNLALLSELVRDSVLLTYDKLWRGGEMSILEEYNSHHSLRNRRVRLSLFGQIVEGMAGRVDSDGRLTLKGADGFTQMIRSEDALLVEAV